MASMYFSSLGKTLLVKSGVFLCLIALAVVAGGFTKSSAQVGISLFPIKYRVTIAPGESYADTITVINPNTFPIGVKPELENIRGGEEGAVDLVESDIPYGLMHWIKIDRTVFTLEANERRQIPFTIEIPMNAEPGGHYGAILFRAIPPEETVGGETSAVGVSGRVGSVVLVEVPGAVVKKGEITSFSGPSYVARGPAEFILKIKNDGNAHFDPQGTVEISGPLQKTVSLPIESRVVFPSYSRTFKIEWPFRYAFGPLKAVANVEIPGDGNHTASLSFFAFPWQEGAGILLLLLILWLAIRTFKKKFKIVRTEHLNQNTNQNTINS